MKNRKYIVGVAFWFIYWILIASFITTFTGNVVRVLMLSLIFVLFQAAMAYINILVLIPKFLEHRKFLLYFSLVVLVIVLLTIIRYYLPKLTAHEMSFRRFDDQGNFRFIGFVFNMVTVYLISTAYHFVIEWFRNSQMSVEMKNKQLETELKYLKTQINPHFLFNTLNNIYTLCYLKDDKAAPSVMKLSEIMRYMLHETNIEKISLTREIQFLENYIELQKLKKDDPKTVNIQFTYAGIKEKHKIAPLVLIVFFENCFKHGNMDNDPEGWIKGEIKVDEHNILHLDIQNTKRHADKNINGGNVGLANAKKRLDMQYTDTYELNINDGSEIYQVYLKIPLDV